MTEHQYQQLGSLDRFKVRPMKWSQIRTEAESLLARVEPGALEGPMVVPVERICEDHLRDMTGIALVYVDVLAEAEGQVSLDEQGEMRLLLPWTEFQSRRQRSTQAHELGHCFLHAEQMRSLVLMPESIVQLRRRTHEPIKAYECPEAQAWCFSRYLLVPEPALLALSHSIGQVPSAFRVSEEFDVSLDFAARRLKDFRWQP